MQVTQLDRRLMGTFELVHRAGEVVELSTCQAAHPARPDGFVRLVRMFQHAVGKCDGAAGIAVDEIEDGLVAEIGHDCERRRRIRTDDARSCSWSLGELGLRNWEVT